MVSRTNWFLCTCIFICVLFYCWLIKGNTTTLWRTSTLEQHFDLKQRKLQTGDLLLFGSDGVGIKFLFRSEWTHVGVVIRENNRLFVCEFNRKKDWNHYSKKPLMDYLTLTSKGGVQWVDLDEKLSTYSGYCSVRSLMYKNKPLSPKHQQTLTKNIKRFCLQVQHVPFDDSAGTMISLTAHRHFLLKYILAPSKTYNSGRKFWAHHVRAVPVQKMGWFCSEFIAILLNQMNIIRLQREEPPDYLAPGDFGSKDQKFSFCDPYSYSNEVVILYFFLF